jgi:hypothetical protein
MLVVGGVSMRITIEAPDAAGTQLDTTRELQRAFGRPYVSHRRIAAPREERPCQRPECMRTGPTRFQLRDITSRTIYLCVGCFAYLPLFLLNALFFQFGDQRKQR